MTSKIQDPRDFRINPVPTTTHFLDATTRPRSNSAKIQATNTATNPSLSPSRPRLDTEPQKDFSGSFYGTNINPISQPPPSPTLKNKDSSANYKRPVVRTKTFSVGDATDPNSRAFQTKKRVFNLEGVKPKVVYDWPLGNSPKNTQTTQAGTLSPDKKPKN